MFFICLGNYIEFDPGNVGTWAKKYIVDFVYYRTAKIRKAKRNAKENNTICFYFRTEVPSAVAEDEYVGEMQNKFVFFSCSLPCSILFLYLCTSVIFINDGVQRNNYFPREA